MSVMKVSSIFDGANYVPISMERGVVYVPFAFKAKVLLGAWTLYMNMAIE